jgi:type IV pilus assembly protein PilY1
MNEVMKKFLAAVSAVAVLVTPASVSAQIDIDPPAPNVLLLVDSSGSMERMVDGTLPVCTPGTATPQNKWTTLLTVLTGVINEQSCQDLKRLSSAFKAEYSINGVAPYDESYVLSHYRPLSKDNNGTPCALGPGVLPPSWLTWPVPSSAFKIHPYNDPLVPCGSGAFRPSYDGILDVFGDRARFGLMTFDGSPESYTGSDGAGYSISTGMDGLWSYYANWGNGGVLSSGKLAGCTTKKMEVGSRNQAAPPWEGRFVPLGPYDETSIDTKSRTSFIQTALIAMRPHGATPLAGMLSDAKDYMSLDVSKDVNGKFISPSQDPYVSGGCRKNYVILLSDGEPNLDLRPECAAPGGKCPYKLPEEIVNEMATDPDPSRQVKTFVVGFGLSTAAGIDCSQMDPVTALAPGGLCSSAADTLKTCCTLHRIAYMGGSNKAFFADNMGTLKSALSSVLSSITTSSTSRTLPVFSSVSTKGGGSLLAPAVAYQFASSFAVPGGTSLWSGNLERKRYVCSNQNGVLQATLAPVDATKGDDFSANVNSNDAVHPRKFFTYINSVNLQKRSSWSARPNVFTDDGLGISNGFLLGAGFQTGEQFAQQLSTPANIPALGMSSLVFPPLCEQLQVNDPQQCALRLVRWNVGETTPGFSLTREPGQCPFGSFCSELGSIYHSTPVVVGPPNEFLRDESYSSFALQNSKRPLVLYTATTDGQLHAFKVSPGELSDAYKVDSLMNNELWSFMPPVVLPRLLGAFNQQSLLLDGSVVVKDVVVSRNYTDAAGVGNGSLWRTVLVAGGGTAGGFYYALDVTDPYSPKFLWQISTDANGVRLFGRTSPNPTITTLVIEDGNGSRNEVAVAVLPGGDAPISNGVCVRQAKDYGHIKFNESYGIRQTVRCWQNASEEGPGRSLTIVRIDNGEVLMNFRGALDEGPPGLVATGRAKVVPFDSPITGVPVAYPSQTGQVASKIYVGDADGSLWRIDVSSTKPNQWSVDFAWDAYAMTGDNAQSSEAIQTAPVISIDPFGNNVILFATGEQTQFSGGYKSQNRVWSLKETNVLGVNSISDNWVQPLTDGTRVTGPITLFNGVAYFSTYSPSDTNTAACSAGNGSIWGVDYLANVAGGPVGRYAVDPNDLSQGYVTNIQQPSGVIVFGVAVAQTPTCIETQTFNDPYLGSRVSVSNVSDSRFELVFQTGGIGGQPSDNSKTKTTTRVLASPRQIARIDSWASVME